MDIEAPVTAAIDRAVEAARRPIVEYFEAQRKKREEESLRRVVAAAIAQAKEELAREKEVAHNSLSKPGVLTLSAEKKEGEEDFEDVQQPLAETLVIAFETEKKSGECLGGVIEEGGLGGFASENEGATIFEGGCTKGKGFGRGLQPGGRLGDFGDGFKGGGNCEVANEMGGGRCELACRFYSKILELGVSCGSPKGIFEKGGAGGSGSGGGLGPLAGIAEHGSKTTTGGGLSIGVFWRGRSGASGSSGGPLCWIAGGEGSEGCENDYDRSVLGCGGYPGAIKSTSAMIIGRHGDFSSGFIGGGRGGRTGKTGGVPLAGGDNGKIESSGSRNEIRCFVGGLPAGTFERGGAGCCGSGGGPGWLTKKKSREVCRFEGGEGGYRSSVGHGGVLGGGSMANGGARESFQEWILGGFLRYAEAYSRSLTGILFFGLGRKPKMESLY